jgi:hypothetical protein
VIILTLFGTTVGLKVLHLPLAPAPATVKLEDAWIAITGSQLTVRSNKDVFVVLRKMVGPHLATWIGLYRPAREIGYDRSGGFYGAGAWLIDSTVDANLLTTVIINLADQIQSVTMDGDRFTQCILEARASFVQPTQTAALVATLSRVSAGCAPAGGNAFVIGGAFPLEVIEWAQRGMSASAFSKVIVGAPEHAPAGGVGSSTQLFPSLPLAIEGAYIRDVTAIRNELELTKVQAQKFQANLATVQTDYKGLQENLERALNNLDKERDHVYALRSQASVIANSAERNNRQDPLVRPKAHGNRSIQDSDLPSEESTSSFDFIYYILIATCLLIIGGFIGYVIGSSTGKKITPQTEAASVHQQSVGSDSQKHSESQDKSSDSSTATSPSAAGPESGSAQVTAPPQTEKPKKSPTKADNPALQGNTTSPNATTSPSAAQKSPAKPQKPAEPQKPAGPR